MMKMLLLLTTCLIGCAADVVIPPDNSDPVLNVQRKTWDKQCLDSKLVSRTLTIDDRFSGEERGTIELAAMKWNTSLGFRAKHYFSKEEASSDPNSKYYQNRHDSNVIIVVNDDPNDVILKALGVDSNTLAITQKWTVYVWPERLHNFYWDPQMYVKVLYNVILHELGHVMYMRHVADPSAVMYGIYNTDNTEPKRADFDEFCSKWNCDGSKLWTDVHANPDECSVEGWQ